VGNNILQITKKKNEGRKEKVEMKKIKTKEKVKTKKKEENELEPVKPIESDTKRKAGPGDPYELFQKNFEEMSNVKRSRRD